ncbi:MAG: hypothetical protein M5U11_14685 [Anaerolineales bacterium]|jgi:hypothetical protein|nr:hypothetical protein [Anaerolineales bacterium]MDX9935784.1 hypothetical protein [Anaerolineales bacterium]GER79703.1 hypothetical protein DIM_17840 [Candidatus Denitrolinea symbiosum]HPP63275.1 hypothetical protein [Anaerolineales bacterium]
MQRFRRLKRRGIPPQPARPCIIVSDDGAFWRLNGNGILERANQPDRFPSHVAADKAIWKTIEAWGKNHSGIRFQKKDI